MNREAFEKWFHVVDCAITQWMAVNGLVFLRVSLGLVFFWFGALKLVPGLSPEEELVHNTTYFLEAAWLMPALAVWEMTIGVGLLSGKFMRFTLLLLFLQMPGTALPLIVWPEIVWTRFPYALSLEGQYIVKNLVLIGAGLVLGATVRGGRIDPNPE